MATFGLLVGGGPAPGTDTFSSEPTAGMASGPGLLAAAREAVFDSLFKGEVIEKLGLDAPRISGSQRHSLPENDRSRSVPCAGRSVSTQAASTRRVSD